MNENVILKYEGINEQSITEKKMKSFLSRLFFKVRDEKTQTPPAVQFAFGRVHNIWAVIETFFFFQNVGKN